MGADSQGAGVSMGTSLKPGLQLFHSISVGLRVRLYLHKPGKGEREERERLAEADCPVLDLGLLAGSSQASELRAAFLASTRGRRGPVISIWALNYL